MPFNPAEIENPYERAFKTWRWLIEHEDDFHHTDHEELAQELLDTYNQFTKAFEIAWKVQNNTLSQTIIKEDE